MITKGKGNLLDASAEALVNTVNCVGVMGRGIALQFKKAYPDNFKEYSKACKLKDVQIGKMFVYDRGSLVNPRYIINFPTKKDWHEKSKLEYIDKGLQDLIDVIRRLKIKSVAVPPLGCGNGGLSWDDVWPRIEGAFKEIPEVTLILFEPGSMPAAAVMPIRTRKPALTLFKAIVLDLINRYLKITDYWMTRLEIQKLVYFMQEGTGLGPKFAKWLYGPYSIGLEHALQDMDGHYLTGCGDNNKPYQEISLKPDVMDEVNAFMEKNADDSIRSQINRVMQLVEGFESPFSMELLASTHFVATHNPNLLAASPEEATEIIHRWNRHKQQFTAYQINRAWQRLEDQSWIMR